MAVRARPDNLALDHPAVAEPAASAFTFEELWGHRDDLQGVCRRIVGDDVKADDVVQETFLRALENATRLDRRVSFAPWLATVARRRSIDQLRAAARTRPVASLPEQASGADDPAEHVLQQERIERVRAALAELGARERQLLLRQAAHGLSLAELAAEEATSIASVRSVLSRARTKLRASLERGGPLGVAPVPGLVAAIKRRLHRWAARFEGNAPMLTGAGAQFGDVVMAAVAAVVLLLAGGTPSAEQGPSDIVAALANSDHAAAGRTNDGGHGGGGRGAAKKATTTTTSTTTSVPTSTSTTSPRGLLPVDDPPDSGDLPWIPDSGSAQPEGSDIEHFAVSGDGRALFAAGSTTTGSGHRLYRSDDEGATWAQLPAREYDSARGGRIFASQSDLYAVSGNALLRSEDGGRTFRPVAPARGAAALLPSAVGGTTRVLLTLPQLVVYDSASVVPEPIGIGPNVTTPSSVAVPLDYATSRVALVGASTGSDTNPGKKLSVAFRCTATTCSRTILPGSTDEPTLHVARDTPGVVLAVARPGLFRSTDNGVTFAPVSLPFPLGDSQVTDGAAGELLLATIGVLGTGGGLYRSVDGGESWSRLTTNSAVDRGARTVVRTPSGRLLAGTYPAPGLLCSEDNGVTWAPRCS